MHSSPEGPWSNFLTRSSDSISMASKLFCTFTQTSELLALLSLQLTTRKEIDESRQKTEFKTEFILKNKLELNGNDFPKQRLLL